MCVRASSPIHVTTFLVGLIATVLAPHCASAQGFLEHNSLIAVAEAADPVLLQRLVAEVQDVIGTSPHDDSWETLGRQRLSGIKDALQPTFKALTGINAGRLGHAAVRYALRRFFAQRRGWVVRGFGTTASLDNSSTASQVLKDHVPSLVQEIFERFVGDRGSSLGDVAALAALLEKLIDEEVAVKLRGVYQLSGVSPGVFVNATKARAIIGLYMMLFIQGYDDHAAFADRKQLDLFVENFHFIYPPWPQTQRMLDEVQVGVATGLTAFAFTDIARVLREGGDRFYKLVHQPQCRETKDMLLEMEDRRSGRVRLLDFYNKAINEQKYQFTENVAYLRQTGMLDETESATPRLLIPNYVSGQANCVARTTYYAICCPDDCESRLVHLEQALGRPAATPAAILAVAGPGALEDGEPKRISSLLAQRLEDIAAHHNGAVPLHGRLFAQWLHFAHPQSCTYPHASGAAYERTMEEWEEETGLYAGSTLDEISGLTQRLSAGDLRSGAEPALDAAAAEADAAWHEVASDMWSMHEELIGSRPADALGAPQASGAHSVGADSAAASTTAAAKGALFLASLAAALVLLFGSLRRGESGKAQPWWRPWRREVIRRAAPKRHYI